MNTFSRNHDMRHGERGVTILFVAIAMVAIIGMAALSIDVVVLYLARQEAQGSADQAALAAARILSVSGITGDPTNTSGHWGAICGPNGLATQAAQAMVAQRSGGQSGAWDHKCHLLRGNRWGYHFQHRLPDSGGGELSFRRQSHGHRAVNPGQPAHLFFAHLGELRQCGQCNGHGGGFQSRIQATSAIKSAEPSLLFSHDV